MPGRSRGSRWLARLLALALFLLAVPAATPAHEPDGRAAHVDAGLRKKAAASPGGSLPVLIVRRDARAAIDAVGAVGGKVGRQLRLGNTLAADVPAASLEALARTPGVVRIADDPLLRSLSDPDPLLDEKLRTVYPKAVQATELWRGRPPIQGTGITVAVLDSGVGSHPDFDASDHRASRIARRVAVATDAQGGPGDDNGHGTFVAGVVAGRGWGAAGRLDDGDYVGIAPDAQLVSVKVSDRKGVARTSDVIAGLEWVVEHRDAFGIRIVNLSLVSSVAESYRTSLLAAAVEMVWLKGVVVVVSAGNGGTDSVKYPPANDPFVIVVGATDDHGTATTEDDTRAPFSSYGATQDGFLKPDLVAPGRRVYATLAPGKSALAQEYPERITPDGLYIRLSGTSAAAPVVAGVAAQVLQSRPGLAPGQLKWLLRQTAAPVPGPGTGAGYPSAPNAIKYNGPLGDANRGLVPNGAVAAAGCAVSLDACSGVGWENVAWDNVAWDGFGWENVAWDNVAWDNVARDDTAGE